MDWVAVPSSRGSHLPDPGIEPTSPALQADSLLLSHHLPSNYEDSEVKRKFYQQCLTQYSGMLLIFHYPVFYLLYAAHPKNSNDSKEWAPLYLNLWGYSMERLGHLQRHR